MDLLIHLSSVSLFVHLLSAYSLSLSIIYLSAHPSICLICLPSIYLFYLSIYLSIHPLGSVSLENPD